MSTNLSTNLSVRDTESSSQLILRNDNRGSRAGSTSSTMGAEIIELELVRVRWESEDKAFR
jgi:hypothetical protein